MAEHPRPHLAGGAGPRAEGDQHRTGGASLLPGSHAAWHTGVQAEVCEAVVIV